MGAVASCSFTLMAAVQPLRQNGLITKRRALGLLSTHPPPLPRFDNAHFTSSARAAPITALKIKTTKKALFQKMHNPLRFPLSAGDERGLVSGWKAQADKRKHIRLSVCVCAHY